MKYNEVSIVWTFFIHPTHHIVLYRDSSVSWAVNKWITWLGVQCCCLFVLNCATLSNWGLLRILSLFVCSKYFFSSLSFTWIVARPLFPLSPVPARRTGLLLFCFSWFLSWMCYISVCAPWKAVAVPVCTTQIVLLPTYISILCLILTRDEQIWMSIMLQFQDIAAN